MEPLLFIAFVYFFAILAFGRTGVRRWRRHRREQALWRWSSAAAGGPVESLVDQFGPPFDIVQGGSRTLYEWKFPPARGLPRAPGLLILYVTVDSAGDVMHTTWQTRGADS